MYLWTGRQDGTETTRGVSPCPKLKEAMRYLRTEVEGYLRTQGYIRSEVGCYLRGRWWVIRGEGELPQKEVVVGYLKKEVAGYLRRRSCAI